MSTHSWISATLHDLAKYAKLNNLIVTERAILQIENMVAVEVQSSEPANEDSMGPLIHLIAVDGKTIESCTGSLAGR